MKEFWHNYPLPKRGGGSHILYGAWVHAVGDPSPNQVPRRRGMESTGKMPEAPEDGKCNSAHLLQSRGWYFRVTSLVPSFPWSAFTGRKDGGSCQTRFCTCRDIKKIETRSSALKLKAS